MRARTVIEQQMQTATLKLKAAAAIIRRSSLFELRKKQLSRDTKINAYR